MKTPKKVEAYFNMIENIKYENENGGSYAYIQFMAYSREVLKLIRPLKDSERFKESIDATNWLLNEYLGVRFTPRHKTIFENKMSETKQLFDSIRESYNEIRVRKHYAASYRVAA
ncbi:MAG: hypothetical protein H0W73_08420 [Bacteroidetes bacterium]|nr:hypothetical protein [Bacteroidota bacterium]